MALEKRITEVQRENKMLDYDLARNNANVAQPQSVTSKVSTMNLNRINNRNNSNIGGKLASITPGSLSINPRGGNNRNFQINSKPGTVSASVDLTGRLGGNRFNTLQTPKNGGSVNLRSHVDRTHNHLEQILSKQE